MLALLAILLAAGPAVAPAPVALPFGSPAGPIYTQASSRLTPPSYSAAYVDFAPANGGGMSALCAGSAVTTYDGGTVTDTRASSAYCTKEGLATTGLTNTSMVLVSNNVPRVETNGNGDLGLRIEPSATNLILQSDSFAAPWNIEQYAILVVLTFNAATTPYNSATAMQIDYPSITTAQYASLYQDVSVTAGVPYTWTIYVKANTGGTQQFMWAFESGSSKGVVPCNAVTTSWTRCRTTLTPAGTGTARFHLGNNFFETATSTPATSWFVAGGQVEQSAVATSYIPTTSAAVSRSSDLVTVTVPTAMTASAGCMGTTVQLLSAGSNSGYVGAYQNASPSLNAIHNNASTADLYIAGSPVTATINTPAAGTTFRASAFWGASTSLTVNGSTITGGAAAPATTLDRVTIGTYNGGNIAGGIYSRVTMDTATARCN